MKPSDSKERVRERVRKHRMLKRLRPNEPRSEADYDPLEMANEILDLLDEIRPHINKWNPNALARHEELTEGVKKLAWILSKESASDPED